MHLAYTRFLMFVNDLYSTSLALISINRYDFNAKKLVNTGGVGAVRRGWQIFDLGTVEVKSPHLSRCGK